MHKLLNLYTNYRTAETAFEEARKSVTFVSPVKLKLMEAEMKELYKTLKLSIIEILRREHEFYQQIHKQNLQLMTNPNFELKVTKVKTSPGVFDKYTTRFEGGILSNGYLYFRSTETNEDFTLQSYASYLNGSLDEHGFGELAHTDTEMALLETLPACYEAKIGTDGSLFMKVTELDLAFERKLIAFELAGDPFNRNEKKRKLFLRNRSEMNRLIAEKMDELEKQISGRK